MIIDGKKIAGEIMENLAREISKLPFQPTLCDVLVGNDSVSRSYVNIKKKAAARVGLNFLEINLPEDIVEEDLIKKINEINRMANICGLIVQLPLPEHIEKTCVLNSVSPEIDVDCLNIQNLEKFYSEKLILMPPTALAVIKILNSLPLNLEKLKIVVVGYGVLVGKPVVRMLEMQNLQCQVVEKFTKNLNQIISSADVIISGTGQAGLITGDMVKTGVIVIDAGTAEMEGGIFGDVDFATVFPKVSFLSPVPGGVGPVTVAMLLSNVVEVAKKKAKNLHLWKNNV